MFWPIIIRIDMVGIECVCDWIWIGFGLDVERVGGSNGPFSVEYGLNHSDETSFVDLLAPTIHYFQEFELRLGDLSAIQFCRVDEVRLDFRDPTCFFPTLMGHQFSVERS